MRMRLKSIPLALAKPGMKVGKPVLNPQGQALIHEGVVLTESSLLSLLKRQIQFIYVLIEELRSEDELAVERVKTVDRLNVLFRGADRAPSLESLHQSILAYRLEKLT